MARSEDHVPPYVRLFLSLMHKLEDNWPVTMVLMLVAIVLLWEFKSR